MRDDLSTPKPVPRQFGMNEESYAIALDNIVKVSVDTFIVNTHSEVLLGQRVDWPVKGLWCFGGRMLPRESFRQTVGRNLQRELGIYISNKDTLDLIGHYSFVWDKRKEGEINNGFHDLLIFMTYKVAHDSIIINDDTHENVKWYSNTELYKCRQDIHPYLWRGLHDAGIV